MDLFFVFVFRYIYYHMLQCKAEASIVIIEKSETIFKIIISFFLKKGGLMQNNAAVNLDKYYKRNCFLNCLYRRMWLR